MKINEALKHAKIEREVEDIYNKGLSFYFLNDNELISHLYNCDGLITKKLNTGKLLKLIIEYKFDELMNNRIFMAKIIIQILYYMKMFENDGEILPNVIMAADKNECFVIHSNDVIKYLDYDCDWNIAPSDAPNKNPKLIKAISVDDNINPFIFDMTKVDDFKVIADKIVDLASNIQRFVRVTEHNISTVFEYFLNNVIKNHKKIDANELVSIFIGVIIDHDNYYQHPTNKNIIVAKDKKYEIHGDKFKSFFSYFEKQYTPQEKMKFTEIADRLIEDTKRRFQGAFYTPTIFVDYAHKMISEQFGDDWKEKYVVWDCCYDKETEFLSQFGWKKISEYDSEKDMVMQYNSNGNAEFVKPNRYIIQSYNEDWVSLSGSQINIMCTKDHNFVVYCDKKDRDQSLKKIPAICLYEKSKLVKNLHFNTPKVFNYNGNIEIDEYILRLAIAINADGCYLPNTTLTNNKNRTKRNTKFTKNDTSVRDCYCISVKKVRKAERLKMLLEKANIPFNYKERNEYKNFTFHFPFNPKQFPVEWYQLSNNSKKIFIDEIFYWDGSMTQQIFNNGRKSIRKQYSTSKKSDADLVSFIFASMGYGVNYREDNNSKKTNYLIALTKVNSAEISNPNNKFELVKNKDGKCYCFEVPSGMLVIRRNYKIYIGSNCCGSCNLTRDYKFKELYCSTLEQSELDIASRYNPEAVKFQYDFLNDDEDDFFNEKSKLPQGLIKAFEENKPIIFFMNPPYGIASNNWGRDGSNKKNIANTHINKTMKEYKIGACSQNLYAQFLYRIMMFKKQYNLTNVHIGLFSPSLYLTGGSWEKFRKVFLNEFSYQKGIIFQASHFADVSDSWGISFTIWCNGETENKNDFIHNVVDVNECEIIFLNKKNIYNIDKLESASDWVKNPIKKLKTFDEPNLSSGIKIRSDNSNTHGKNLKNHFGYFLNAANNVNENMQKVALFTSAYGNGHGNGINNDNYLKCTSLFTARKCIDGNWVNDKDEYMKPNTGHSSYAEYEADSIVYSLFNNSSNQSSLRNITYKRKQWNIYNHFFWMSRDKIMELANQYNNDYCYNDARTDKDRYTYEMIEKYKDKMSPYAKMVLDKANRLLIKSFEYRDIFNQEHSEFQINNWDVGYYQLKPLWKQYFEEEFGQFRELYKRLTEKLRPQVYELGFLK